MMSENNFYLSVFLVYMVVIMVMVSPNRGIRDNHTHHNLTTVGSRARSAACSVDFLDKVADCSQRQLKDVPSDLIQDLSSLDLTSNLIQRLLNTSFVRYSLLEVLNLSNNLINFIDIGTFYPLAQLTSLILDSNPIYNLNGSDLFQKSGRLSSLSIQYCNLTCFPNDTLGFLPQLKSLNLYDNELTYINISMCPERKLNNIVLSDNPLQEISADSLSILCKTDKLFLGETSYKKIEADAIANLPIRSLVFGFLQHRPALSFEVWKNLLIGIALSEIDELSLVLAIMFSDLPRDFFDPLWGKSLYLILQQNAFKLHPDIFASLNSVYKMDLITFDIGVLEPSFFNGMRELRSLRAIGTMIQHVNPAGASWQVDLLELNLSENNIENLNPLAFKGLNNLTLLDLTLNAMLFNVPSAHLSGQLQTLNISRTRVSEMRLRTPLLTIFVYNFRAYDWWRSLSVFIPGQTFQYTPSLNRIDLTSSYVVMRELWDSSQKISLFKGLHNLTHLELKQNRLLRLPAGVFDDLLALQILDLTNCQVFAIESGTFDSLASLTTLFLQDNNLQILPMHILDNLIKLNIFSIKENALFYIDKSLFDETLITSLDLSINQLTTFNETTFSRISNTLSSIDLSQNPIECSCSSKWLNKFLSGTIEVQNANQTTCSFASQKPFKGKEVLSIHPDDLCSQKFVVFVLAIFSVLSFTIIIVITYHFRWSIKYNLFLLRLAVLGYVEILDEYEREDYDFDIHVISTDDDFKWIQDHLKPTLQVILPYYERRRIVFTEDDLPIGRHRLEAIDGVLTRSFKVLVLMSKSAIADDWFLTCFRMAIDQVDDSKTENIVLVFLENIKEDEMPFLVRLYMGGQGPYLQWVDNDEEGQEYFRKSLLKCISVNRKRNRYIPPE
ncbi:toll-like receptor 3 [Lytechinus variegatus]|uniref:toll-like receptor 3 n=1 Tax=Lytechinus variegatus TaxID=7654 RepID=UPI001BB299CA|nr:toll-like receptor 3 [Lytechinus variegatus]